MCRASVLSMPLFVEGIDELVPASRPQQTDIRQLQALLHQGRRLQQPPIGLPRKSVPRSEAFISVSKRGGMGAELEVRFPALSLDLLDMDDAMYTLVGVSLK
jgi:hypothetical protein